MTIKTHGRMFTDNTVGITQLALEDGSVNQAIVTDGSGTLSFATVGAGGSVGSSVYIEDIRTGDGTTTTFTLSVGAPYEESLLVFIDGVAQPTSSFTLPSTTSITFTPAPGNGAAIRICHLGIASSLADCAVTGAKICMGSDAAGDILFYNGSTYQRLGIGTTGQHLATNAAANAPEWVAAGANLVKVWNVSTTARFITSTEFGEEYPDGTIPQSSEGLEILNLPITASAAGNKLLFQFHAMGGTTSSPSIMMALFRTSGPSSSANALFATAGHVNSSVFASWHTLEDALTTTVSNYQVRMARGNSGNVTINDYNEYFAGLPAYVGNFGVANKCSLTVIEYVP